MKYHIIEASLMLYYVDEESGAKIPMRNIEKIYNLTDPDLFHMHSDDIIRRAKINILDDIMLSILPHQTAEEKARDAACEQYRAMRRKTKGLSIKDQLKAINDFRAGRFESEKGGEK